MTAIIVFHEGGQFVLSVTTPQLPAPCGVTTTITPAEITLFNFLLLVEISLTFAK